MSATLVHHFLERQAECGPDRPFVLHEDQIRTYGEVDARANAIARLLISEGVTAGDRVAILARNSPLYVEEYYGILKAGAVAVPLNTAADPASLAFFLSDCGAQALVVGKGCERQAMRALAHDSTVERILAESTAPLAGVGSRLSDVALEDLKGEPAPPRGPRRIDLDLASIIYTSGSTGRPQGAALTHLNLVTNTRSIVEYLQLTSGDRMLAVLPFYYVYGKSLLNTHAAAGGSVVIENRFA